MKPGSPPKRRAARTRATGPADAARGGDPAFAAIAALLPADSHVLVVGDDAAALRDALATGGRRVSSADATTDDEAPDLGVEFRGARFDAVVICGVLERMRAPWVLLESARTLLAEGGAAIALVLNTGDDAVRLAASLGPAGDDDERLRPVSQSAIEALFEESGFAAPGVERITYGADAGGASDEGTLQFIVRAVPIAGAWDGTALRRRLHRVEALREELAARVRAREGEARTLSAMVDDALAARALAETAAADATRIARELAAERDALAAHVERSDPALEDARAELARERENAAEAASALEAATDRANRAEARATHQVEAVVATAAAARAHADSLARDVDDLRTLLLGVEAERDRAEARADGAAQRIADLQARADELEQQLAESGLQSVRLEELAAVNDHERARSIELESTVARQTVTLAAYEARLARADESLAQRERYLHRIVTENDARLAQLEAANASLTARVRSAQADAAALATRMASIAESIGAVPLQPLEQAVGELQRRNAQLQAQFEVAQDQLAELLDGRRKEGLVRIALEHELAEFERAATA